MSPWKLTAYSKNELSNRHSKEEAAVPFMNYSLKSHTITFAFILLRLHQQVQPTLKGRELGSTFWSKKHQKSFNIFYNDHRDVCAHTHINSLHSYPTLCNPMDCSLLGFLVHGILQARILEWVAILLQGIFPTQGWNLCLLHILCWKAGSLLLKSHEKQHFSLPVSYYRINLWDSFLSSPRFRWHMKSSVLPSPSQYGCRL